MNDHLCENKLLDVNIGELQTSCSAATVDKRSSGDLLISCMWLGLLTITSHRSIAGTLKMAPGYCTKKRWLSHSDPSGQTHLLATLSDHLFSMTNKTNCSKVRGQWTGGPISGNVIQLPSFSETFYERWQALTFGLSELASLRNRNSRKPTARNP